MDIILPHNYWPRSYQQKVFVDFEKGTKRFINVWHRRSGKDKTWINLTIPQMLDRVGQYYHILPAYTQAKTVIWEGMGDDGFPFIDHFPRPLIMARNETEMKITLQNGSIWKLMGSDRIDLMMGTNPVGVVMSEYSLQTPEAWRLLSPILLENAGWASFIFTPRGKNHAYDLWRANRNNPGWHTSLLTVDGTRRDSPPELARRPNGEQALPVISRESIDEEIRNGTIDEDTAQQEYWCSFEGTFQGSYYGKLMVQLAENHITRVPHDPRLPVDTIWDLGRSDANGIWFVQSFFGREFRIIRYYQSEGQGLEHYIKYLKEHPYNYGTHWAPHDIEVTEYTTNTKRIDAARRLGINFRVVPKIPIQDGVQAVRRILPMCYFDAQLCASGIDCLSNYHKQYDEKKRIYLDNPVHDEWSHGADAFRYFATISDRVESELVQPNVARGASVETEFNLFPDEDRL